MAAKPGGTTPTDTSGLKCTCHHRLHKLIDLLGVLVCTVPGCLCLYAVGVKKR